MFHMGTIFSDWDGVLPPNETKEFFISFLFNRSITTNQITITFVDNTSGAVYSDSVVGFFTPADQLPGSFIAQSFQFLKLFWRVFPNIPYHHPFLYEL